MKVLDIYPNLYWSFNCQDRATLKRLQAAAATEDAELRDSRMKEIAGGKAYRFVGKATALNLAGHFFDGINVHYTPPEDEAISLRMLIRRWVKPTGRVHIPEPRSESTEVLGSDLPPAERLVRLMQTRFRPVRGH